jgi:hypothetical protein
MLRHEPMLPPEFVYPIEDWRMVEREFTPAFLSQMEILWERRPVNGSVFALVGWSRSPNGTWRRFLTR